MLADNRSEPSQLRIVLNVQGEISAVNKELYDRLKLFSIIIDVNYLRSIDFVPVFLVFF